MVNQLEDKKGIFGFTMLNHGEDKCFPAIENYSLLTPRQKGDKWIKHGALDRMPLNYLRAYREALIHNRATKLTAKLVAGSGFNITVPEQICRRNADGFYETIDNPFGEEAIQIAEMWLKNVSARKYQKDAAINMAISGSYYGFRQVGRGRIPRENFRAGGTEPFVRRLRIESFENMRLGEVREWRDEDFISLYHFISDDFEGTYNKIVAYDEFINRGNKKLVGRIPVYSDIDANDNPIILEPGTYSKICGTFDPSRKYYPTPYYESKAAMYYFVVDFMISQMDFNDLKNGFPLEYILVVNRQQLSNAEDENAKKAQEIKQMRRDYKGVTGAKTAIMWASPETDAQGKVINKEPVSVITIPTGKSNERFDTLRKQMKSATLTAHGLPAEEILGIPSFSGTGFSSESTKLITGLELFIFNTIKPQQQIIEADLTEEIQKAGIYVDLTTNNERPMLEVISESLLSNNYTTDEIRAKFGDEPLPEDETLEDELQ